MDEMNLSEVPPDQNMGTRTVHTYVVERSMSQKSKYTALPRTAFVVATAIIFSGLLSHETHAQFGPGTVPLQLYWSAQRGDNFTTATAQGRAGARAAGYTFVRVESYVYRQQVPGTVPLQLYWSAERGDNFTTAMAQGRADARAAGYSFVRVEGYVYRQQVPGTVPLQLYWSAERGDNFTTATAQGRADARAAGYVYVRVEGYVFPTP